MKKNANAKLNVVPCMQIFKTCKKCVTVKGDYLDKKQKNFTIYSIPTKYTCWDLINRDVKYMEDAKY